MILLDEVFMSGSRLHRRAAIFASLRGEEIK